MAWIYLAESAESLSPLNHGSDQSPIASVTDGHKAFYFAECDRVSFLEPQSGTMWERSPHSSWVVSTSLLEDSPARTSALQVLESAWKAADQAYFSKSFASLANFDRDSFSWKTSQLSLFGGLTEFSWSSLRWGSIVGGRLYQPERWAPRTSESDGFFWPTPTARDWKDWNNTKSHGRHSDCLPVFLYQMLGIHPTVALYELVMNYPAQWTKLEDWAMQWYRPKRGKLSKDFSELMEAADHSA